MMNAQPHHIPERALWRNQRIGLLGGSFNPAHDAHLHISKEALKRLDIDRVVWMVSPGNPLKETSLGDSFEKRLADTRDFVRHPRIEVSDIEARLGTIYTVDTLGFLQHLMPSTRFTWLMGADNMAQFPLWLDWRTIMSIVPVAVFDRPRYSIKALMGRVAQEFAFARVPESKARNLADMVAPAWTFVHCPRHPLSSTRLRNAEHNRAIT